jgi:putative glycerol-1-phosphate prenyltransferase
MQNIYQNFFLNASDKGKQLAVLIDPDKTSGSDLLNTITIANNSKVDFFLVGGSLLLHDSLDSCITTIKANSTIPVILFPGNALHINAKADAVLLLSLISGRNADLLIGQHVQAAPLLKQAKIETIATGYMLIDGGKPTTVSYISNTMPIPADKPEIAAATALAGEMLGLKSIYLEAGSGAQNPVSTAIISTVKKHINVPLIVGGGIKNAEAAIAACNAGADIIVIGNATEKNPELIAEIASAIHALK